MYFQVSNRHVDLEGNKHCIQKDYCSIERAIYKNRREIFVRGTLSNQKAANELEVW